MLYSGDVDIVLRLKPVQRTLNHVTQPEYSATSTLNVQRNDK